MPLNSSPIPPPPPKKGSISLFAPPFPLLSLTAATLFYISFSSSSIWASAHWPIDIGQKQILAQIKFERQPKCVANGKMNEIIKKFAFREKSPQKYMRIKMGRHWAVNIAFAFFPIFLPILLVNAKGTLFHPPSNQNNENGANQKEKMANFQSNNIDQIRPFRLTEKRVHEQPGIEGGWKKKKRARTDDGEKNDANGKGKLSTDWQIPDSEEAKLLEQVPTIDAHADFTFLANQSLVHFRTATYQLRHDQCLEVHFRVEGKRTRLLLYTCRMYEGGLCVLDKFLATTSVKKLDRAAESELDVCHKMQPWMFLPSPFAFHFRFVRRPRKFADREIEMRHFRRRFGRHATREVGRVKLAGFHPCNVTCQRDRQEEGDETELREEIRLAEFQDRHMEDPLEGWGK